MPIQLTSAFDPGDFDPGASYHQLCVEAFRWEPTYAEFDCYYGNTVSGEWVRGTEARLITHRALDADKAALQALEPTIRAGYDPTPEAFYQFLIDKGYFAGTIL